MIDISKIEEYGANSLRKALSDMPRIRRRRTTGHLAFTVTPQRNGPRYIVRLALESGRAFAECVNAETGETCQGFSRWHHCYHLGRALIFMSKR
jgi:hypothetical protein